MRQVRILANDGLEASAIAHLEAHGFEVRTTHVPQDALADYINQENIEALLVRSATKVRKVLIDACPGLRFVGRGGVGMDNIDVAYAREKGMLVTNTPAASTDSVAEMVFAHVFALARYLHHANRVMPTEGVAKFGALKKSYANAFELRGKTIGIIGFGRIGQAVAKMAFSLGMRVLPFDPLVKETELEIDFLQTGDTFTIAMETVSLQEVFAQSDVITFHVPMPEDGKPLVSMAEMKQMKKGVLLINTARGGIIHESDLLEALSQSLIGGAGLDVFDHEPTPLEALLTHPSISVSPHVGGSTAEAQERIGMEMAGYVMAHFS
jgi:D-3-phosphoglycerate dehydrogenase / 2-oxoglutarate reductase